MNGGPILRSWIPAAVLTVGGLVGSWLIGAELRSIVTDPPVVRFEFPALGVGTEGLLAAWDEREAELARLAIELDFRFIFAYVALGLGLVLLAWKRLGGARRRWLMLGLPPAAGILDWLENRGMLDLLDGRFAGHVPVLVTIFAAAKFLLLALGAIVLLRLGVKALWQQLRLQTWLVPLLAATAWSGSAVCLFGGRGLAASLLGGIGLALLAAIAVRAVVKYRSDRLEADVLDFAAVLSAEQEQIESLRPKVAVETPYVGLALSGGGIRSATFNLGLLQALARLGLLSKLDYLSTVSGGGYIGSWLMQWVRREATANTRSSEPDRHAIEKVERALGGEGHKGQTEPPPVTHLRNYSNYLTPQVGLFAADTWTTIATYARNFLLNLLLIGALASFVLLLPRALQAAWAAADPAAVRWWLYAALVLAGLALLNIARNLRLAALGLEGERPILTSQGGVQRWGVLPLVLATILASHWFGSEDGKEWSRWSWALVTGVLYTGPWLLFGWVTSLRRLSRRGTGDGGSPTDGSAAAPGWIPDAARKVADWTGGKIRQWFVPGVEGFERKAEGWVHAIATLALAGLPVGAVCGLLLYELKRWATGADSWALLTLGAPILMALFSLSAVLSIGLVGVRLDDYLREWMARAGAWILIYALGWLAFLGLAVYGPVAIVAIGPLGQGAISSGWLLTSVAGALAGNAQQQGQGRRWHGPILQLAPWVFVIGLVLVLAWGLDAGLSRPPAGAPVAESWQELQEAARLSRVTESMSLESEGRTLRLERRDKTSSAWLQGIARAHRELLDEQVEDGQFWYWLVLMAGIALLLGWRIDINEFSMHNYYRNRLVRAFLGASNPHRADHAQPFTGMDTEDDSPLGRAAPLRPVHIVNTCLNLVSGKRLAWQQRKAAALAMTPLHTGFELPATERGEVGYAYRSTAQLPRLTLGTAMAISGAAASPNMGYQSTPALALLLTFFNVRLGWWLGNPNRQETCDRVSPRFALKPLLAELFGLTSLDSDYVYLSDGAHFENLALYELVRRRCRYIIVSDVGTDPELAFEDLGNAIRKCRNDLGTEIDIDVETLRRGADGLSRRHCVVGRVRYLPETEGDSADTGWLLYIKSTMTGDEPEDVQQYALENPSFPHQSTGDQFFDEPQFESYRKLGQHVGERVFGSASTMLGSRFRNWERLFADLSQRWYAPSAAIERSFSKHGDALAELFDQLRSERKLRFLDSQIYGEIDPAVPSRARGLPMRADEWIAGFYFCNAMIQLMENVYLDLKLDEEYSHPDNRGWMQLFRRWANAPMFQATWAASAVTYGSRFQSFAERALGLTLGEIEMEKPTGEPEKELRAGMARGLARTLKPDADVQSVLAGLPPDAELWQLFVDAQGLRFPIGLALVLPGTSGSHARLLYFEIRRSLRKCGLAQRALRFLSRQHRVRLAGEKIRIAEISDDRWKRFRHFFNGAVVG